MMETIGLIVLCVMGGIGLIYLVIFSLAPDIGRKRTQTDLISITSIPMPALNDRARIIMDQALRFFYRKEKIDLKKHPLAMRRLADASIKAEKELRVKDSAEIRLPAIVQDESGATAFEMTVYRELLDGKR